MTSNVFSWHVKANEYHQGVQIDLLIDRADNVIDVCEMKYAPDGYNLTTTSLNNIKTKLNVLRQYVPAKKFVEPVLITSNGLLKNKNSKEITMQVTADQLFEPYR